MKVELSPDMQVKLSAYLNKKFAECVAANGHQFTVRQFASEIGINEKTLLRMMNAKTNKSVQWENLQKLVAHFGRDFAFEMGINYD